MAQISSYVFLDLETTGFPWQEGNRTRITELAMVAARTDQLLAAADNPDHLPRVLHKLVLCFRPDRPIHPKVVEVTSLSAHNLQNESSFNVVGFETISNFIECQKKPVCFVVHNGNRFDYPILRAEIDKIKSSLPDHVLCIDSLPMFRQLLKKPKKSNQVKQPVQDNFSDDFNDDFDDFITEDDLQDIAKLEKNHSGDLSDMIMNNPAQSSPNNKAGVSNESNKTRQSFKLIQIYSTLFGVEPLNAHRAENDCIILMQSCIAKIKEFIEWSNQKHVRFNEIPMMKVGEKWGDLYKKPVAAVNTKIINDQICID